LRPRPIESGVDEDVSDLLGPEFLRVRWEAEHGVDPTVDEALLGVRREHDLHVPPWVEADIARHRRHEGLAARRLPRDRAPPELSHRAYLCGPEQLVASAVDAGQPDGAFARVGGEDQP